MDYSLTKEQKMVQQLAREFAQKEVKPLAEEIDEEKDSRLSQPKKCLSLVFTAAPFPRRLADRAEILFHIQSV